MPTYSLTLWFCKGCSNGAFPPGAGVATSDEGKDMFKRWVRGLKGPGPGEEAGVVVAVREGSWVGSGGRLP